MAFCVDVWSKAGLAHIKGHSFHIGGAVELLLAGVPPEIIATTGGCLPPLLAQDGGDPPNVHIQGLPEVADH